jgi:hypothetical protein
MLISAYNVASPNLIQSIVFTANNTYNATSNSPIVVVNSVSNATTTIPSARVSYNTTHVKIITNATYVLSTYNVNYDYEASATVFGISLGWMGALVMIGVGIALLIKMLFRNK